MPTKITGNEPYFTDANGLKSHGIFVPVTPYIVQALNARLPENRDRFEKDITELITALKKYPGACHALLSMLDYLRAKGLVLMEIRKTIALQYHTPEHSAEAAHDTGNELQREYTQLFSNAEDQTANEFFIELAKSAMAWHDVVQHKAPPKNEVGSAAQFAQQLRHELTQFIQHFPALEEPVTRLISHIEFIANELIIYNTWLVFSMSKQTGLAAKTLRVYIEEAAKIMGIQDDSHEPMMQRLFIATRVISLSDVSRYALQHVLKEQVVYNAYLTLPAELQHPIEAFFTANGIHDPAEKEAFLGLIGTHVRMFTELNLPANETNSDPPIPNTANISGEDYVEFIQALTALKNSSNPVRVNFNFLKLFDLLMNAYALKEKAISVDREQTFARAQHTAMWDQYAEQLEAIKHYIPTLSQDEVCHLSQCIFILSTHFQPGVKYLKEDKAFQEIRKIAFKPDTFAIEIKS